MQVLIAEQDPMVSKNLTGMLENWGYKVDNAENGIEAWVDLAREMNHPNIAVLDWSMPELTQMDICRKVKDSLDHFVYTILLVDRDSSDEVMDLLDKGADDFLLKPINEEELKSRLLVATRIIEYETELSDKNSLLENQNDVLEVYAENLESLVEERANQIIHTERLASLGEMAAGIAHEISNYMAPIKGYAALIKIMAENSEASDDLKDNLNDSVKYIEEGVQRTMNLVGRIRTHSRSCPSMKLPCSINNIIHNALEITSNKVKQLSLDLHLEESIPPIELNEQEIEQIFINILKNAADAMGNSNNKKLRITSSLKSDFIIVTIKDSGPGIPEKYLDSIWHSFFTTKDQEQGTGLGLSISKVIVNNHQGKITALNHPNGGACFCIRLPLKQEEISETKENKSEVDEVNLLKQIMSEELH